MSLPDAETDESARIGLLHRLEKAEERLREALDGDRQVEQFARRLEEVENELGTVLGLTN